METGLAEVLEVQRCTRCGGLWFDEFELEDLKTHRSAEQVDTGHADQATRRSQQQLRCPKCRTLMLRVVDREQPHIWYETCEVCRGSFLDAGEFKDLLHHSFADRIKDLLVELKGGRSGKTAKLSPAMLRKVLQ